MPSKDTMTTDSLQLWLNAAGRYPLLPKHEIIRLAKKRDTFEEGSFQYLKIVNKISQHNLRLLPGIVRCYLSKRPGMSMSSDVSLDLLQQGYIGLRRAAEKYDGTKGYTFSTYAYAWIRQAMSRWYASNERAIYIPENCMTEILYIKRNGKRSESKNGKLAEHIIDSARRTMDITSIDTYLESPDHHDNCTLAEIMTEKNKVISSEPLPKGNAMERISRLMVECDLDLITRDVIKNYGRRGRMSIVSSKLKIPSSECKEIYENGISLLKAHVEQKQKEKALLLSDRMKCN